MITRLRSWIVRPAERFRKAQGGAAAIEFGLLAAPFLFLLMAIFETGLMLFTEYVVENGVAKAARMIRTGQVQNEGITAAQFKEEICGNLLTYFDCEERLYVDVQSFTKFSDITTPNSISDDGELTEDVTVNSNFEPGDPMDVVVVRAYYDWQLMTPGITYLANLANGRRLLTASAAFRNEPFSND